ncbi:hypothetical protein ACIBG8_08045 [Nonomuraea sp. NPDC050556]|uniref:hypothetical protein n=1 Tax=Nonomuraea sp. NPDC050556 TaxID=3364369 RepID=UPI0037A49B5D
MKPFSLAITVLTLSLGVAPAHASTSDAVCFSGSRTPTGGGYYKVSASGCDGHSGTTVTIRFGPAAGTYSCGWTFLWNSQLGAENCLVSSSA